MRANLSSLLVGLGFALGLVFVLGAAPQTATALPISGGFTHMQVFTIPGMHTFNVPAGVKRIQVEVRGGGGGGGQGNLGSTVGQGGSGGGYGQGIFNVTGGSSHTAFVGAGGMGSTSGTCTVGGPGGGSSFGALIGATGGGGGGGCGTTSLPGTSTAPLAFAGQVGRQYFNATGAPENPGGLCGDGTTVGMGGNGNAFFGRDGSAGNVVVRW